MFRLCQRKRYHRSRCRSTEENKIEEDAIEAGASDFIFDDDCYMIYTEKEDYHNVHNYLEKKGYTIISSEIGMVPDSYITLPDEEAEKVNVLLDILDEDEDIKSVWHNLK